MEVRKALTCVLISVFLWAGDAQDSVPDSGESFQSCFNSELKYEISHSLIHRTRFMWLICANSKLGAWFSRVIWVKHFIRIKTRTINYSVWLSMSVDYIG